MTLAIISKNARSRGDFIKVHRVMNCDYVWINSVDKFMDLVTEDHIIIITKGWESIKNSDVLKRLIDVHDSKKLHKYERWSRQPLNKRNWDAKLAIIAPSYHDAEELADKYLISHWDWKFVTNHIVIKNLPSDATIIFSGVWMLRAPAEDIAHAVFQHDVKHKEGKRK